MSATRTSFKQGQSGNPAGRAPGSRNRASLAVDVLLDGEAEAITRKAVEMAKGGDPTALRLVLDRIVPPRRERRIALDLPPIETPADAVKAAAVIVAAVSTGDLLLSEAAELTRLVENVSRTIATNDLAARIEQLEKARPR